MMLKCVLAGIHIERTRLRGGYLFFSSLQKCDMHDVDFTNGHMARADRRGAQFYRCTLKDNFLDFGS